MNNNKTQTKDISEFRIICYSSLYLPVSMALLPVTLYIIPYYAELGISLYAMSLIIFGARLSDAFTDPLIGVLSDKTETRLGKRKPWILAGTPLLMLSLYYLFLPPDQPTVWYFGFWIVLLYLAYTIISLPYYAWGAELSSCYETRSHITGRREQFHFGGNLCFNLLPLTAAVIIFLTTTESTGIGEMIAGFSGEFTAIMKSRAGNIDVVLEWLTTFSLILIPIAVFLALFLVPENKNVPLARQNTSFLKSLRVVRRNGPYLRVVIAYTVSVMGLYITASVGYFFLKHVVQAGQLYPIFLLCYYGSCVLGLPLWIKLSRRVGKGKALAYCFLYYGICASAIPFIPAGEFGVFLVVMCFKGSAVGAFSALATSMAADAIDIDYARTGKQRAGLYFALWGMLRKGVGAAGGAVGISLAAYFGFSATADPALAGTPEGNSQSSLIWLGLIYSVIPAALNFVCLPLLWNYPLTAERHGRLRERIERKIALSEA